MRLRSRIRNNRRARILKRKKLSGFRRLVHSTTMPTLSVAFLWITTASLAHSHDMFSEADASETHAECSMCELGSLLQNPLVASSGGSVPPVVATLEHLATNDFIDATYFCVQACPRGPPAWA